MPLNKMLSQKELILKDLKAGEFLTKLDILNRHGCFNSGARISELRQDGYNIDKIWKKKNNKTFAAYFLIAEGLRRRF